MKETKNNWILCDKKCISLNSNLKGHSSFSIFNSLNWILHLENLGWQCFCWENVINKNESSFVVSFIKFYPLNTAIVWIPGGIIGSNKNILTLNKSIRLSLNLKHCYIRLRSQNEYNSQEIINFLLNKWAIPNYILGTNMTLILDIKSDIKKIYSKFSRNWKRSISKSIKNKIIYSRVYESEKIALLYNQMYKCKSLKRHEIYSHQYIDSIIKVFKDNVIIFGAFNSSNKLLAIRGAIVSENRKAIDIFAACGEEGRNIAVSNGLFFRLIEECKANNCDFYDLSGIDPLNSRGVYLFKNGTGGLPISIVGEFESSSSPFLALIINFYLFLKRKIFN